MTGETNQDDHKDRKQSMTRKRENNKIKQEMTQLKLKTMTSDGK